LTSALVVVVVIAFSSRFVVPALVGGEVGVEDPAPTRAVRSTYRRS
jgi:hypothetical protein